MKKVGRRNVSLGALATAATGYMLPRLSWASPVPANSAPADGRCEAAPNPRHGASPSPSKEVAAFIQSRQDRHYRNLADELGLGGDPMSAFRTLTKGLPTPMQAHAWAKQERQRYANTLDFSDEYWTTLEKLVADTAEQMRSVQVPTIYEEPTLYNSLLMTYNRLSEVLDRDCNYKPPMLATLAAGEVNARISVARDSNTRVIFFEQGLFHYFGSASNVLAWCLPQINLQALTDATKLEAIPNRYTIPETAIMVFGQLMHGYVVQGAPWMASGDQLPRADHNILLLISLVSDMECFALAHEISHIRLGHADRQDLEQADETSADLAGVGLVLGLNPNDTSRAFRFWACYLTLCILELLDRALILYAFGNKPVKWVNMLYPDFYSRRGSLRTALLQQQFGMTKFETAMAETLCRMSDQIISHVWEEYSLLTIAGYQMRQLPLPKPSPMWRKRINACYAPKET